MKSRTIPIVFAHSLLAHAKNDKNIDIVTLLNKAGISQREFENKRARISNSTFSELCRLTYESMQDEFTGHLTQRQKLGTFTVITRYAANAETLESSIFNMIELYSLFDNGITLTLKQKTSNQVAFRVNTDPSCDFHPWVYESLLVCLHRILCWLCETHFLLHHVNMCYPKPDYVEEYHYLFNAPVFFNQKNSEIVFKKQDLQLSINKNEEQLHSYISRIPYDLLHIPRNEKSYAEKVRNHLKRNLPKIPEYEEIARSLNIHPQTLRRRLKKEGCDYRQIRNELIRDIALSYLQQGELEIKQISYTLGFSEPSAFIRSFKRWTGTTPSKYRSKNRLN
jgi:AraC-like DNA-binding protein